MALAYNYVIGLSIAILCKYLHLYTKTTSKIFIRIERHKDLILIWSSHYVPGFNEGPLTLVKLKFLGEKLTIT